MKRVLLILSILFFINSGFSQQSYTIKTGDTLYSIAKKNGINTMQLKEANPLLKVYDLTVGTKIIIPSSIKKNGYYTLKAGDTLYSIAKRNNLSIEDLLKANPGINSNDLKIGQILNLPSFHRENSRNKFEKTTEFNQKIRGYQIKKGDTFYSLAKQFKIDVETLRNLNPSIDTLKVGQDIYLPPIEDGFIRHRVKKGETIFSITRKYNVTLDILLKNNRKLKRGLKQGMILMIPVKSDAQIEKESKKEQKKLERLKYANYTKVIYILPFNANNYQTTEKRSLSTTEFYMGALFALDSLANQGRKILVKTFDNKGSLKETKNILRKIDSTDIDLIIGPLRSKNVHWLADNITNKDIKIISPFSDEVSVTGRENLIKANLNQQTIVEKLSTKIKEKNNYDKIYIIGNERASLETDLKKYFKNSLFEQFVPTENLDLTKVPERSTFVLNTANPEDVKKVIEQIYNSKDLKNKKISLFGLGYNSAYVKGHGYNGDYLGNEMLTDLHLTVVIAHYFNDNKPNIYKAKFDYKQKNKALPDLYSSTGFDWTYYMLLNKRYKKPAKQKQEGLFSKINLQKTNDGGYINQGVFVISYY